MPEPAKLRAPLTHSKKRYDMEFSMQTYSCETTQHTKEEIEALGFTVAMLSHIFKGERWASQVPPMDTVTVCNHAVSLCNNTYHHWALYPVEYVAAIRAYLQAQGDERHYTIAKHIEDQRLAGIHPEAGAARCGKIQVFIKLAAWGTTATVTVITYVAEGGEKVAA